MLEWFLKILLNVLLKRVERLAVKTIQQHETQKKREDINEENVAKYVAAQDRLAKIKAATALLNGTGSP